MTERGKEHKIVKLRQVQYIVGPINFRIEEKYLQWVLLNEEIAQPGERNRQKCILERYIPMCKMSPSCDTESAYSP